MSIKQCLILSRVHASLYSNQSHEGLQWHEINVYDLHMINVCILPRPEPVVNGRVQGADDDQGEQEVKQVCDDGVVGS
jgi:hypothetical protein